MEVIHIQPILHLLLIGGGGERSIWVKSHSCSKAVPTLQHTIYGKQNKRSRKIGFEHYRPKRIIVNTSCSVQGLPWAPSAFKAEKGNIKLEQQPGFAVCFLTRLDGAVSTCGRAQAGHYPSLAPALHLALSLRAPARARPRGKHSSAPQGCPLPQRPQPAPSSDGSALLAPQQPALAILAEARAPEGSDAAGKGGAGTSRTGTRSCTGQAYSGLGLLLKAPHHCPNTDAGASPSLRHHRQNSPWPCPGDPGLPATRATEQQWLQQGQPFPPFPPRSRPHPPGALSQIPRPRRLPADRTV